MHELYACTCQVCNLAASEDEAAAELSPLWDDLLKRIYEGAVTAGEIDDATAIHMAENLMNGVTEGFGKGFEAIDYNTPDFLMLEHLEHSVYHFSAAKSFQMNKELTSLLKDGDKVRTFEDWRREAIRTVDLWVNNYGRTEYNTAVTGGQGAANWVRFKEHENVMPNLQYQTVGDMRVRDEHRILDGIIRAMDDPFWSTYYPPNGWNCRCDVIQLPGDDQPTETMPTLPDIPKMFRINLAEKNMALPPDHPYYTGISDKKLNKWVNKNLPDRE